MQQSQATNQHSSTPGNRDPEFLPGSNALLRIVTAFCSPDPNPLPAFA